MKGYERRVSILHGFGLGLLSVPTSPKALKDVDINRRVSLLTGGAPHIRDGRTSVVALLGGYERL